MFDNSKYEKALSDFVLKTATYSYIKKLKEYNIILPEGSDTALDDAQVAAGTLREELLKLPPPAQSKLLMQRIEEILKATV